MANSLFNKEIHMADNLTTEAVRLALNVSQQRAEIASTNIARANMPNAEYMKADFSSAMQLLQSVANNQGQLADTFYVSQMRSAQLHPQMGSMAKEQLSLDEQVAELSTESIKYQSLSEALSRQFGLMRLAITGRNQ
jgi:flagellar basal-body rod protein FlgB